MTNNDGIVYEPRGRRRKYRVSAKSRGSDCNGSSRWMVLLSVNKLEDIQEQDPAASSPSPLGHKPSFKGGSNKLARRARSFKDDFLGKISQMRTPQAAGAGRSPRGQSPKARADLGRPPAGRGPAHELEEWRKQIQVALKHLRDVVYKQKLEMLPGNGTIVLDTVWQINLLVKSGENSNSIKAATLHMYRCVARLIKLCDDILIDDKSSELDMENVNEIVQQVEDAVKNLINLAQENLSQPHPSGYKTTPRSSYSSSLEMPAQRNSLPDIPLTPKEREILENNSYVTLVGVRNSHSTESILRDSSPPPKPPLPERLRRSQPNNCITPPPLPPKKKHVRMQQLADEVLYSNNSPRSNGCERISLRSKSPDDSISLQSESVGSLDSILNNSREEDEIRDLMDPESMFIENHPSDIMGANCSNPWEESSLTSFLSVNDYHRLSNTDSGIGSVRSSNYSRDSQTSTASSQFVHHVTKQTKVQSSFESSFRSGGNVSFDNLTTNFSQSSSSSSSSVVMMNSVVVSKDESPPAIPEKTKKKTERQPSPYDNVPDQKMGELLITCERHQSHHSLSNSTIITNSWEQDSNEPPPLPPKKKHIMAYMEMFGNCSHTSSQEFLRHSAQLARPCALARPGPPQDQDPPETTHPPALPPKQRPRRPSAAYSPPPSRPGAAKPPPSPAPQMLPDLLEHATCGGGGGGGEEEEEGVVEEGEDLMEELDVERWLLRKKEGEEGPDVRGGPVDALIIQATKATKNGVFIYQEAFLTTYRTFISPKELITKLIRRYNHFYYVSDKKPRSREAFALIVRVVSDLTTLDLDEELQLKLMNFVQELISCGELTLAKALRVKLLQRHEAKLTAARGPPSAAPCAMPGVATAVSLLEFKSEQIAEQMTLLDAELFMKIEIPEVLMWAQEQNEERSPNLTRFTEHFNKMSYWARTRILTAESKDAREKYFSKFIKIMKHLRKINNFNSYLALLSALDSAPVRRLEWQKQVQDGLKDYCALIDSSSSFRAYRMALAETQPPCIPYIGLILQDLTFVHIGNTNLLPEGTINFSKRWQQFNILENMKKFKKETYTFKKQERIISFFQSFDDFIGEEKMWKLSETIKPRGKKTPH